MHVLVPIVGRLQAKHPHVLVDVQRMTSRQISGALADGSIDFGVLSFDPKQSDLKFVREWVKWGAGLRASQALILAAKARALIMGRYHISVADIQALARPVLRHRLIPNFYAESERITPDNLIDRLLEAVPTPRSGM